MNSIDINPENGTLDRTFFIGGPPRVGKSLLAYALAKEVSGHVVSTDSMRNAAKKACNESESDLFIINKNENVSEEEWLKSHLEHPEKLLIFRIESQSPFGLHLFHSAIVFPKIWKTISWRV